MSQKLSASLGPVYQIIDLATGNVTKRIISNTQDITVHGKDRQGNTVEKFFGRNDSQTYVNDLESERIAAEANGYLADFEKKVARVEEANAAYNAKIASKGLERRLIGFANTVSTPK